MNAKTKTIISMTAVSLSAAFLIGGYEFVRTAAASLFIDTFTTARMPYALTAVPFAAIALIYLYGRTLSVYGSVKTLMLSFALTFAVFITAYVAVSAGSKTAVAVFYIFAEVYIVILVEQYWSFINSTLKSEQAKIYNGPIAGGTAIGPLTAGWIIRNHTGTIGTENLILFAAAAIIPTAFFIYKAYSLSGEPKPSEKEKNGRSGPLHLSLIIKTHPLLILMFIIFLSQMLSTVVNLKFYHILEKTIDLKDMRTAYLGGFWMKVNFIAFILQFIIAPFLLKKIPLRIIMIAIPCIHLINAVMLFYMPILPVAALALLSFKSIDYSIFRAGKELFYIPLSYDARYRAKQVVDAFTYRFSKGATAGALSLWRLLSGSVPSSAYSLIAAGAGALWFILAFPLTKKAQ